MLSLMRYLDLDKNGEVKHGDLSFTMMLVHVKPHSDIINIVLLKKYLLTHSKLYKISKKYDKSIEPQNLNIFAIALKCSNFLTKTEKSQMVQYILNLHKEKKGFKISYK